MPDLNGIAAVFLFLLLFGIPILTILSGGNPWGTSRSDVPKEHRFWERDH